ncbi:MAG TPA: HEAT repeat domain-containing protein [Polyangiaceae bacterium]|nr:HEAT repeat domain-containing protein [Polyangiaceae bacterium]
MRTGRALLCCGLLVYSLCAGAFGGHTERVAEALVWPDVVVQVERDLGQSDVEVRRKAARRMGQLPRAAAARLLETALLDLDPIVRQEAARVAIRVRFAHAAAIVPSWLADPDAGLRKSAARVLATFPLENTAVSALARGLNDPEPGVREAVVDALGKSGTPEALTALSGHLDDSEPRVTLGVIAALEYGGDPRSTLSLIAKLQDVNPGIRSRAARALGTLGGEQSVTALALALGDSDPVVRAWVARALGRIGSEASVEPLGRVLQNDKEESQVRVAALNALARVPSVASLKWLLWAHDPVRPEIHSEAVAALAKLAPACAEQAACRSRVEACVNEDTFSPRVESCASSLASMRLPSAYDTIARALTRGALRVNGAIEAYERLGDPRALPWLLAQLTSDEPSVRLKAAQTAAQILSRGAPDGRAVEPVVVALTRADSSVEERIVLIELLGKTRTPRAQTALRPFATACTPLPVRAAALRALGRLGGFEQDTRRLLLEALEGAEPLERFEAARAIRRGADASLAVTLVARLESREAVDPSSVALALLGPVHGASDAKLAARLEHLLASAKAPEQDALVEALGQMVGPGIVPSLMRIAGQSENARAKVAEALAGAADVALPPAETAARADALVHLLADPSNRVRANAVWSLARWSASGVGRAPSSQLRALAKDSDEAVASNAIAALAAGEVNAGQSAAEREALDAAFCDALGDQRAYVRANALVAMAKTNANCALERVLWLLAGDPDPVVRERAAFSLRAWLSASSQAEVAPPGLRPSGQTAERGQGATARADTGSAALGAEAGTSGAFVEAGLRPASEQRGTVVRGLQRCLDNDVSARVARACDLAAPEDDASLVFDQRPDETNLVRAEESRATVFVVPEGLGAPVAGAPFALALPSHWLRLGNADRRGAVFESGETGALRLEIAPGLGPR